MELIRAYRRAMEEALANEGYSLVEGGASSFEDYRFRTGIRKGMKKAMQVFEDVVKDLIDEKDDPGY